MTQGKAGYRLHGADASGPRQRRRRDSAFLWAAMTMRNAFFPERRGSRPSPGTCLSAGRPVHSARVRHGHRAAQEPFAKPCIRDGDGGGMFPGNGKGRPPEGPAWW
ncbi:hypothetical protein HMPREF3038_01062 [Akkermansia sp. KLE1797]|nr:hypothetical protein HMPREF3038_01062 [Akkermansia sp. KLE1797]KXU53423.1 hypothetical protein HMPREF3039_02425 [Akkermansia sp. KLE1798]KZA05038.1 hypothetical protein HMPREF1326_01256 [Akkermansia sp. KLE1605]